MKAAVLYEPNQPLQIKNLRLEGPKDGEVRVRIGASGICASDHHVMLGQTQFPMPIVLGHEGAGVITELGGNVSRLNVGDRVVMSFVPFCGWCKSCRSGHTNLCDTHKATGGKMFDGTFRMFDDDGNGMYQFGKLGVFAEEVVVPAQSCYLIPDEIKTEEACLIGCAVSTGVASVVNQVGMKPGTSMAVFGTGGVGLNSLQAGRLMSAYPIIAVDIFDHKLEYARQFGATHTINSSKSDAVKQIMEITDGGVQYGFDTFGHTATTEQMMASLRKNGRGVLVGLAPIGMKASLELVDITRNEKELVGSYYGSANPFDTFEMIFGLIRIGKIDVMKLIERRYELAQINEAYKDLETGSQGRGVIMFS